MLSKEELKIGSPVYYHYPRKGDIPQNGIIKSFSDDEHVFVVYHWDENLKDYQNYTAARTRICDLHPGWVDKDGRTPLHQELAELKQFGLNEGIR